MTAFVITALKSWNLSLPDNMARFFLPIGDHINEVPLYQHLVNSWDQREVVVKDLNHSFLVSSCMGTKLSFLLIHDLDITFLKVYIMETNQ